MKKLFNLLIFLIFAYNMYGQTFNAGCSIDTLNRITPLSLPEIVSPLPVLNPPVNPPAGPQLDPSEYRMVYWVHGMNGGSESWSRAKTASTVLLAAGAIPDWKPRKIFSSLPDYSNVQITLDIAADELNAKLVKDSRLPQDYDEGKGFIIAHSQGGLVSRTIRYHDIRSQNPSKFGGLATFGTPHRGAVALTGQNKILGYQFFETAALDLAAGPANDFQNQIDKINSNFFLRLFNKQIDLNANELFENLIRKFFFYDPTFDNSGALLSLIRNKVESNISKEMTTDSPVLEEIARVNPNIPSVAFYGVKETYTFQGNAEHPAPIVIEPMWAMMNYAFYDVNESDYFKATDDEWRVAAKAQEMQLDYLEVAHQFYDAVDILDHGHCIHIGVQCDCDFGTQSFLALNPAARRTLSKSQRGKACRKKFKADYMQRLAFSGWQYERGANWVSKANDLWEVSIGGVTKEDVPTGYCFRNLLNLMTGETTIQRYAPANGTCGGNDAPPVPQGYKALGDWRQEKTPTVIKKENDGAVLAESARDIPYRTSDMMWDFHDVSRMYGSTHMSMRNDENLKPALDHLFKGHVGPFFKTAEQE